jgi:hypothetical protein
MESWALFVWLVGFISCYSRLLIRKAIAFFSQAFQVQCISYKLSSAPVSFFAWEMAFWLERTNCGARGAWSDVCWFAWVVGKKKGMSRYLRQHVNAKEICPQEAFSYRHSHRALIFYVQVQYSSYRGQLYHGTILKRVSWLPK